MRFLVFVIYLKRVAGNEHFTRCKMAERSQCFQSLSVSLPPPQSVLLSGLACALEMLLS